MNEPTIRPDRLRHLRQLCLALPGATEKAAWGDPTWRAGGKIFAMQKGNFAGGRPSVWVKALAGHQAELVQGRPETCFVPPYVGAKGWVGIWLDGARVDWELVRALVRESHGCVTRASEGARDATRKRTPRRR